MSNAIVSSKRTTRLVGCLILVTTAAAQQGPTILQVDLENWVNYYSDVTDPAKLAKSSTPLAAALPTNFYSNVIIADVTAINGSAAKGVMVMQNQQIALTPTPAPGQAISDVIRSTCVFFRWEFLKPDGTPIGSIFSLGLSGGTPAPGSPQGSANGNVAIIGGTGAYLGVRGSVNMVGSSNVRAASQGEDPSMRRINGGGTGRFLLQIWPMTRPEILVNSGIPSVFHADSSPVTSGNPAKAGEVLVLFASGLGPTIPGVDLGQPFPTAKPQVVNSPIQVLVNGASGDVPYAGGYPGATDIYQVNFRIPSGTLAGQAGIQLIAAWISGGSVKIPIQ